MVEKSMMMWNFYRSPDFWRQNNDNNELIKENLELKIENSMLKHELSTLKFVLKSVLRKRNQTQKLYEQKAEIAKEAKELSSKCKFSIYFRPSSPGGVKSKIDVQSKWKKSFNKGSS